MNKKLNILLLTSIPLHRSANLGMNTVKSLEKAGHHVDVITKYPFDGMSSNVFPVYELQPPLSFRNRLKKKFPFLKRLIFLNYFRTKTDYVIVNKIENEPNVDTGLIIDKIQKDYDLVITLFWERMLTTASLKAVYNKLKCPIFIQAVDMFPMTGGCYYFWDCRKFMNSCGKCPGLLSDNENDQTHKNFLIKKEVYSSIEYIYLGNTWMCEWAKKAPLFNASLVKKSGIVIDQDFFLNRDKKEAKSLFQLPSQKKFVMFAGASGLNIKRKGAWVLVETINSFSAGLSPEERSQVLLVLAGDNGDAIQKYFQIEVYCVGFLDASKLALAYAAADVYLSTTLDDAGPSMVNQALMCGTPVVAFEIGVALDVVKTGETGFLVKYNDVDNYTQGIRNIYHMDTEEKALMNQKCREIALQENSFSSYADGIERIYEDYMRTLSVKDSL